MIQSRISAFWGPRAQSADESAEVIWTFLSNLAAVDVSLDNWRERASTSIEATKQPLINDPAQLSDLLRSGQNRRDDDGTVITELGCSIGLWNGDASINILIGATSQWVQNSLSIVLPDPALRPDLYEYDSARTILSLIINAFHPDRAVWTNSVLTKRQTEPDSLTDDGGYILGQLVGHPAGWGTFLVDESSVVFDPELLPQSAKVERVNSGALVIVGNEPGNPPIEDVLQIRRAMGYKVP
ncbi:Imm52 family immunity protein [Mycobacteroides abscessus]